MAENRVPHPPDCDCPTCRADFEEQKARAMTKNRVPTCICVPNGVECDLTCRCPHHFGTEDRVPPHPWIAHDFDCECHDALCGRCGCTNPYTPEQPAPPLDAVIKWMNDKDHNPVIYEDYGGPSIECRAKGCTVSQYDWWTEHIEAYKHETGPR